MDAKDLIKSHKEMKTKNLHWSEKVLPNNFILQLDWIRP